MQNTIKLPVSTAPARFEEKIQAAYQAFRHRLTLANADQFFLNAAQYLQALTQTGEGCLILQMRKGLSFTVRRNIWDAQSIRETLVEPSFLRRLSLGRKPVVVEVGGYIGGFAIYAIKAFKAAQVITYEPCSDNFGLLSQNVVNNTLDHRITPVHAAVDCLAKLFSQHQLGQVDLLKVDASRNQLDWLATAPQHLLHQVRNIVVSLPSEGVGAIAPVLNHLTASGYTLRTEKGLVYASL